VSQKRGPWLNIILVLAVLAFVGFSMIPLLGSVFEQKQPSARTATPQTTPTISTDQRAQLEKQAEGYQLVVQREPQNETALRGLLEAKLKLGDIKGAIAPLEQLAKLHPEQSDYAVLLAQAKQQTGDREGAAQTYRSILASKPGNMNALQGLVSLLVQQGRPEAAIGLLQDTLKTANSVNEMQPGTIDVPSVQLLLGQIYASQQNYPAAIAIYDETIKINKDDFRPVLAKALILKQQGKPEEAKPLFTTAISLAPPQYKDQVKQLAGEAPTPSQSPAVSPSPSSTSSSSTTTPSATSNSTSSPPTSTVPSSGTTPVAPEKSDEPN